MSVLSYQPEIHLADYSDDHRPRIVILNRSYWPDMEATGQLLTDLCEHLAHTFNMHVICGQPNSPANRFYLREGIESRAGVTIHRLRHARFAKRGPMRRLMNYFSFSRAASKYLRENLLSSDVLVSETDPFFLPVIAARHSHRTGCRLICYLQDVYPDVAEAVGGAKFGLGAGLIRARLREAYRQADRIVVLGNCMQDRLRLPPWSLESSDMQVIPNWADCDSIKPLPIDANRFRQHEGLEGKLVVMHSGNMGLTQRLDVLIQATADPAWPENAVLLLVGDGAARESLERQAAALHPRTSSSPHHPVLFFPYQPREQLAESLSAADLHVVSMHEKISGCLCPSKLYGILAAGRPVIAVASDATDLCQSVTQYGLGWCCRPGDPKCIAETVAIAASDTQRRLDVGKRARDIACTHFDRHIVIEQFADMMNELVTHPTANRRLVTGH